MKLFIDSADVAEIEQCLMRGFAGVTTNPTLLGKVSAPESDDPEEKIVGALRVVVEACQRHGVRRDDSEYKSFPELSVEVWSEEVVDQIDQALRLVNALKYGKTLAIKIPIGWNELESIARVSVFARVNCTCIFTEGQAYAALQAGAHYVSVFCARLRDIGGDPVRVIETLRMVMDRDWPGREIIAGSIRSGQDIADLGSAGAHIVTAGLKHYQQMAHHPKTVESVHGFLGDLQKWLKPSVVEE
jgi:transaldolase